MSLSVDTMQHALSKISYKPGWGFEVYEGIHEGPHIRITAELVDAYDQNKTTTIDVHSALPPSESVAQFLDWLLWRIKIIEVHEAREFFRYCDKPWSDPHAPDAGRDELVRTWI